MRRGSATLRSFAGATAALLAVASMSLLAVRSWRIDYPYSIDFQVYWLAGVRVTSGQAADLYLPGGGPAEGTPREMPAYEFKNIPVVALAFAPLAGLPYLTAKRVFWWIGLASLLASAVLLGVGLLPPTLGDRATRTAWAIAFLGVLAPAHTSLRHGQTTPVVLLAITGWLVASARGRGRRAGVWAGLGSAVKIPVLALGVLDALLRRGRAVAAWVVTLGAVAALSVALFGPELHRQYFEGLLQHAGTVMTGHNNQSVAASVARLAGSYRVNDWEPRPLGGGSLAVTFAITLAMAAAVAAGLLAEGRRRGPGRFGILFGFPAAMALGIVALPVAWDHYFLLLAPGLVSLAVGLGERGLLDRPAVGAALAAAIAGIALPTPTGVLERATAWGLPGAVLISHYFLGAVMMLALSIVGMRARGPDAGDRSATGDTTR